jgi:hypothetical protein
MVSGTVRAERDGWHPAPLDLAGYRTSQVYISDHRGHIRPPDSRRKYRMGGQAGRRNKSGPNRNPRATSIKSACEQAQSAGVTNSVQ